MFSSSLQHLPPVFILVRLHRTSSPPLTPPPSSTFLNSAASPVSLLCDYVPSVPLFNLIKENAIQLSFSWPIASPPPPPLATSYCYSLTLYSCQSGTRPMLFPGTDVVALAIMTSLLVSQTRRSAPEDTAAAVLDEPRYSFMLGAP